jgi:hypothetical protein
MAGIDLATAQTQLNQYIAAEPKVLAGQKVVIDGTEFTRANLDSIHAGIKLWDERVQRLAATASRGGRSVRRVVPIV